MLNPLGLAGEPINPLQWLTYVQQNLHEDTPSEEIKLMLPYYYKESRELIRETLYLCNTA